MYTQTHLWSFAITYDYKLACHAHEPIFINSNYGVQYSTVTPDNAILSLSLSVCVCVCVWVGSVSLFLSSYFMLTSITNTILEVAACIKYCMHIQICKSARSSWRNPRQRAPRVRKVLANSEYRDKRHWHTHTHTLGASEFPWLGLTMQQQQQTTRYIVANRNQKAYSYRPLNGI